MQQTIPKYWLFLRIEPAARRWSFTLQPAEDAPPVQAADVEPSVSPDRLELLTLVRALEALDQPSTVTLVGGGTQLWRGLRYGLAEWRENNWQWESYGELLPVPDADLWKRVDRALEFHRIDCRSQRVDPPHTLPGPARPGIRFHTHRRPTTEAPQVENAAPSESNSVTRPKPAAQLRPLLGWLLGSAS